MTERTERVGGYRVVRRLATGGTSDVLLAKAEGPHGFERTVVLKLLLSQFRNDDELARMFAREASAYARLSHPSIVRLFDFFASPTTEPGSAPNPGGRDGQLVMVLEYIDGPPLTRLRTMLKAIGKELDDKAAIYVAARVFDALTAAHMATDETGAMAPVIHRDVNPSNVLVPWDGHVKLADFGVAKVTGLSHQSVAGMIKGTYGYMAPEQVTGEMVTPRADVYAGGVILWELLSKRRAFQRGALPEIEALRAMAEPRLLSLDTIRPDVDKGVRDAVKRALEPQPSKRTITAEEIVSVLTSVVPSDEGREHLVAALNAVRNDPRAQSAAMASESRPPPATAAAPGREITAPMPQAPGKPPPLPSSSRGMLPKPAGPPRPASVPRMTPAAPVYSSLLPANLTAPADGSPPPPPAVTPRPHLAAPEPPKRPSGALRLGLPDTKRNPAELQNQLALGSRQEGAGPTLVPSSDKVSIFDSLVEAPQPVADPAVLAAVQQIPSDRSGRGVPIDEILRGVPSSMPPSVLSGERRSSSSRLRTPSSSAIPVPPPPRLNMTLPGGSMHPTTEAPREARADPPKMRTEAAQNVSKPASPAPPTTTAKMGKFPEAPPPLVARPPAEKNDFRETVREMIATSEAPTVVPPPSQEQSDPVPSPPTPRMMSFGKTLAMDSRPADPLPQLYSPVPPAPPPLTPRSGQPAHSAPQGQPEPIAAYGPPTPIGPHVTGGSGAPQNNPSTPAGVARPAFASFYDREQQAPPPPKKGSTGLVLGILAAVMAVGIVGTIGFVRYQKAQQPLTTLTATTSSPPLPSVTTPAAASSTAAIPPATASSAPSAAPSATPSATPVASSEAPAIDAAMGVIKTTGTAPGRRIFVDDKTLGQTPESVTVACGTHNVKLGSSGKPQKIDVPCGGEISVADKL